MSSDQVDLSDTTLRVPEDPRVLEDLRRLILDNRAEMHRALGRPPGMNPALDLELYERRVAGDESIAATLASLFVLAIPVPVAVAAKALGPVSPARLAELGLAEFDGQLVRPRVALEEQEGLIVASDPLSHLQEPDFVLGDNQVARRVARLTVRRRVARALDLGTGSGIQALLAARHAEQVVAVDINERALAFARFNARLNGTANVELRAGDWFEPVAGERFDLVVANPPYIVSPDSALLFRDSGHSGDALTRQLVRDVPRYLEEDGFAHLIGNWIHGREEDWRTPIEACIAGSGCDALLLKYATVDPVRYASHWNRGEAAAGSDAYLSAVDRWLEYYEREGIEAISEVVVVLRRRTSGRNWVHAIEVPGSPTRAAGEHVLRLFQARDRRGELSDDDTLLAARLAPAPGLKVVRTAKGARLTQQSARAELEAGIGFATAISLELADALASLDGTGGLGRVVDASFAPEVRRLLELGLVVLG